MMRTARRVVVVIVGTRRSFDTTRMRTGARDSVVNARRWSRRGSDAKRRDRWTRKTRWIAFQSALACALGSMLTFAPPQAREWVIPLDSVTTWSDAGELARAMLDE